MTIVPGGAACIRCGKIPGGIFREIAEAPCLMGVESSAALVALLREVAPGF